MSNPAWHLGTIVAAFTLLTATRAESPTPARLATVAASVAGGPPDTLVANPRATSITWKGSAVAGQAAQEGTVPLASGMFVLRHEMLTSGTFTVDMRRFAMTGGGLLHPASSRPVRDYLSGSAYFDVDRYPVATFTSSGMQRVGPSRWRVSGDITMHGVTRPLTFDADVQWGELGHMVATTTFTLDRRTFGVGTGGTSLLDDQLTVSIQLDAQRKAKLASHAQVSE